MYYISYFFIKMANGGHRKVNEAVLNGWLGKLVRLTIYYVHWAEEYLITLKI